jgi:hypothetical protein
MALVNSVSAPVLRIADQNASAKRSRFAIDPGRRKFLMPREDPRSAFEDCCRCLGRPSPAYDKTIQHVAAIPFFGLLGW